MNKVAGIRGTSPKRGRGMGVLQSRHFTEVKLPGDKQAVDRLNDCAVKDSAHVMFTEPREKGVHVSRIQAALFLLMPGAAISGDELGGETYGPSTAEAVFRYKDSRTPKILGPGQKQPDRIVGIQTIRSLDAAMKRIEGGGNGGGGNGGGGNAGALRVVPQPPGEQFLLALVSDDDGNGGRPLKADLDSTSRQLASTSVVAKVRVWAAKLGIGAAALDVLEKFALGQLQPLTPLFPTLKTNPVMNLGELLRGLVAAGKLEVDVFAEITFRDILKFPDVDETRKMSPRAVSTNQQLLRNEMSVGGATALTMFSFWLANTGAPALSNFPALDAETAKSANFIASAENFERMLTANLKRQGALGLVDYHDLVTGPGPERGKAPTAAEEPGKATSRMLPATEPDIPGMSLVQDTVVKICIGSFQGIRVFLSDFKVTGRAFSGTLKYELRDHFGVDDDDCEVARKGIHGTPGQVAMWVLQHFAPIGHKPFLDQVFATRSFSGTL